MAGDEALTEAGTEATAAALTLHEVAMQSRYNPFSNAPALADHPVSRRGAAMVMLLEPKEVDGGNDEARHATAEQAAEEPASASDEAEAR